MKIQLKLSHKAYLYNPAMQMLNEYDKKYDMVKILNDFFTMRMKATLCDGIKPGKLSTSYRECEHVTT